jgi:hypothetical protein
MYKRASLMGLLFAMVGFSFAVATTDSRGLSTADAAGSRVVGSATLRFTNPLVGGSTDRDLGDVTLGSFLVRYARATGGVRPYKFTSTRTPTLKEVLTGGTSTLDLLLNGALTGAGTQAGGTIAGLAASKFPLRFNIDVSDSKGSNAGTAFGLFRFSLESTTTFKFANDQLCEGIQYQPYMDILATVNGNGAVAYTVSNVTLNGAAVAGGLEALGLTMSGTDGTIFGKPFAAGTVTFLATAKDAKNASALNRAKTAVNQTVTFTITGNAIVQSDFVTTSCQVKVGAGAGKDSIKFAALANLNGRKLSDLNKDVVVLKVGGYTTPNTTATPGTLDDKGKITKAPKGQKNVVTYKGAVSLKGTVKLQVGKEDLSQEITGITGGTKLLAVGLEVGDAFASAEVLQFTVKSGSKGSTLSYKFSAATNPGGTFLETKVSGKDDTKSAAEDTSFKVSLIATPGGKFAASGFTQGLVTGVSSAQVNIGSNFTDTISVSETKGKVKSTEKRDPKSAKVTKLQLDVVKGKGSLTTGFLPKTSTGISEGAKAKASDPNTLPVNIVLLQGTTVLYFGEGSLAIAPKKNGYANPTK